MVNIYNVPKTGQVEVKRDFDKTTLTLITCTKNSKTEQTVYVFELYAKNGESIHEWIHWYRFFNYIFLSNVSFSIKYA